MRKSANQPLIYGAFKTVPAGLTQEGRWVEDSGALNATKGEIDSVAAKGGKVLFLEISPEFVTYLDELTKITGLRWEGKYEPPKKLPKNLRESLNWTLNTLFRPGSGVLSGGEARRFVRSDVLTESGRYILDVLTHARKKGFQIVPLVKHEFLQTAIDYYEQGRRLRRDGKESEAKECQKKQDMAAVEMEHFMKKEIERQIRNGILPDIVVCGQAHSKEVEGLLTAKGLNPFRKDMPLSVLPRYVRERVESKEPLFPILRKEYKRERKRQIQRLASTINAVKEKKQAQKDKWKFWRRIKRRK